MNLLWRSFLSEAQKLLFFMLILSVNREIPVLSAHQEKLVQSAPRVSQESLELKVSEDFQDQWSDFT